MIKPTGFFVDLDAIRTDYKLINDRNYPIRNNQICLRYPAYVTNKLEQYTFGCESLRTIQWKDTPLVVKEEHFNLWHTDWIETKTIEEITKLSNELNFKMGRVRFRKLLPITTTTAHFDSPKIRFHLALYTNEDCVFNFRNKRGKWKSYTIPADGQFYYFNPIEIHMAINGSPIHDRTHLVINTI